MYDTAKQRPTPGYTCQMMHNQARRRPNVVRDSLQQVSGGIILTQRLHPQYEYSCPSYDFVGIGQQLSGADS
jgi:hypothetical protein